MREAAQPKSLLVEPERHPLNPPEAASTLGSTMFFAPHPDDESLGCGGLLALLGDAGVAASVIVMTDGSRSHLHSASHPAERLAAVRECETLDALDALGWTADDAHFLRFPDCGLPLPDTPAFSEAAMRLHEIVAAFSPDTVLVPWRRDPHCDHEATWRLVRATVDGMSRCPRWLEYPVWAWPRADDEVAPRQDEGSAWRLDISPVLDRKRRAISQHRSQLGTLIRDDPSGFVLQPEMIAHFTRPWELFIEPSDV